MGLYLSGHMCPASMLRVKHVVFKFTEDANMLWWAFRFKSIGFFIIFQFSLEAIFSSAVGFKLCTLNHIKHVVFKFIEDASMLWWAFRFKSIGFFIIVIDIVVM